MGWEVEGAAVGDEADLSEEEMRMRRVQYAMVEGMLYFQWRRV